LLCGSSGPIIATDSGRDIPPREERRIGAKLAAAPGGVKPARFAV